MVDRDCTECGNSFTPLTGRQRVCCKCKPTVDKRRRQEWAQKHPDRVKGYFKKYRDLNRDQIRELQKKRDQDPARKSAKAAAVRRWRARNSERNRKICARWRKNNRAQVNEMNRRRYYREQGVPGSHTLEEWHALQKFYRFRCAKCGKKRKLTRDHIKPITQGGSDNIDNIQPLCGPCNSVKHTQEIRYANANIS